MTTRIRLPNRESVTCAVGGFCGLVGVILLAIVNLFTRKSIR